MRKAAYDNLARNLKILRGSAARDLIGTRAGFGRGLHADEFIRQLEDVIISGSPGKHLELHDIQRLALANGFDGVEAWRKLLYGSPCLSFDGVDDVVDVGNNAIFNFTTADFLIESWIKRSGANGTIVERGLSQTDGYTVEFDPYLHFLTHQVGAYTYYRSANPVTASVWEHWAALRRGTTMGLYRNGVEDVPYTAQYVIVAPISSTRSLTIGKGNTFGIVNGLLDETRIWNVTGMTLAQIEAQIRTNMYRRLLGTESGLVGYWRMDEASGILALDSTPNVNHGTITGATRVVSELVFY